MEKKGTPIAIQPAGKKEGRSSFAAPRCNGTALFWFPTNGVSSLRLVFNASVSHSF